MLPDWLIERAEALFPEWGKNRIFIVSYNFEMESYVYSWRWTSDCKEYKIERHVTLLQMKYSVLSPECTLDHVFSTVAEEIAKV